MKRKYDVEGWRQFRLLRMATQHPETSKADGAVFAEIIQRYHGQHGNGWATHEHLGITSGSARSTVIRSVRNLERLNFITVLSKGRRGRASVYLPNFDLIPLKGVVDDTLSIGVADDTETSELGVTHDTINSSFGIMGDTPSYLRDRLTRAESQVSRDNDCAPASPPLTAGLEAAVAGGAQDGFDELYKAYNYRRNRADAKAAYAEINPDHDLHSAMVAAAIEWQSAWAAQNKPDAPRKHLSSWLSKECYLEEPPTAFKPKERTPTAKKTPAPANTNMPVAIPTTPHLETDMINSNQDETDHSEEWAGGDIKATIVEPIMDLDEGGNPRVTLQLICDDATGTWPHSNWQHQFYAEHHDIRRQDEGQKFIAQLVEAAGLAELDNVEQLCGRAVQCTVDEFFDVQKYSLIDEEGA